MSDFGNENDEYGTVHKKCSSKLPRGFFSKVLCRLYLQVWNKVTAEFVPTSRNAHAQPVTLDHESLTRETWHNVGNQAKFFSNARSWMIRNSMTEDSTQIAIETYNTLTNNLLQSGYCLTFWSQEIQFDDVFYDSTRQFISY